MELKDLVGKHTFSGIDFLTENLPPDMALLAGDVSTTVNFVLDGVTYTAIEDPGDGYRTAMKEVGRSSAVVVNMFPPCPVVAAMSTDRDDELLILRDVSTGEIVLEVGTSDFEDYYPTFVSRYSPENMAQNHPPAALP